MNETAADILIVAIGALGTLLIWGAVAYWLVREEPAPPPAPPAAPPPARSAAAPAGSPESSGSFAEPPAPPATEARPIDDPPRR